MSGTQIDITQALKDTENSLRDFIAEVMERKFGAEWPGKCGLPSDRIEKWKQRKAEEREKGQGVARRGVDSLLSYILIKFNMPIIRDTLKMVKA